MDRLKNVWNGFWKNSTAHKSIKRSLKYDSHKKIMKNMKSYSRLAFVTNYPNLWEK